MRMGLGHSLRPRPGVATSCPVDRRAHAWHSGRGPNGSAPTSSGAWDDRPRSGTRSKTSQTVTDHGVRKRRDQGYWVLDPWWGYVLARTQRSSFEPGRSRVGQCIRDTARQTPPSSAKLRAGAPMLTVAAQGTCQTPVVGICDRAADRAAESSGFGESNGYFPVRLTAQHREGSCLACRRSQRSPRLGQPREATCGAQAGTPPPTTLRGPVRSRCSRTRWRESGASGGRNS